MNVKKFKPYCLFENPTRGLVVISQRWVGGTIKNKEAKEGVVERHVVKGHGM
jgi:hypothetical protein